MENEKSSYFDHEIMNLVEKYVGTPAILGSSTLLKPTRPTVIKIAICDRATRS
jgi:hypothetical protein